MPRPAPSSQPLAVWRKRLDPDLAPYLAVADPDNPGPAAVGVVVSDQSGAVLREEGRVIGRATNAAETAALLEKAGPDAPVLAIASDIFEPSVLKF